MRSPCTAEEIPTTPVAMESESTLGACPPNVTARCRRCALSGNLINLARTLAHSERSDWEESTRR